MQVNASDQVYSGCATEHYVKLNKKVPPEILTSLSGIDEPGRLADTVWIFISDNGYGAGEHRWRDKSCEYYICHRVPFVVARERRAEPGTAGRGQGRRRRRPPRNVSTAARRSGRGDGFHR